MVFECDALALHFDLGMKNRINEIENQRDRVIALLLYETGIRLSQLVNLRRDDLRDCALNLEGRIIPFSSQLDIELGKYIRETQFSSCFLFFSRENKQLSERRVQQILKSYNIFSPSRLRSKKVLESLQNDGISSQHTFGLKSIRKKEFLSQLQIKQLLSLSLTPRDYSIILLMLECGITLRHLVRLKWKNLKNNKISFMSEDSRYPSKRISFVTTDKLAKNLNLLKKESNCEYIFGSHRGGQFTERRIQQIISSVSCDLDFKVNSQILRNTYIMMNLKDYSKNSSKTKGLDQNSSLLPKNLRVFDGFYQLPEEVISVL